MPWTKGQSGNPGGRPKVEMEVIELARSKSVRAVERLAEWVESDNPTASVAAAKAILDRGYGRPAQTHDIAVSAMWGPEAMASARQSLRRKLGLACTPRDAVDTETDAGA